MGKKWRNTCGLQTPLLLVILCFTQHLLAKPVFAASAKKGKTSTVAKTPGNSSQKTASAHAITKPTKNPQQKPSTKMWQRSPHLALPFIPPANRPLSFPQRNIREPALPNPSKDPLAKKLSPTVSENQQSTSRKNTIRLLFL